MINDSTSLIIIISIFAFLLFHYLLFLLRIIRGLNNLTPDQNIKIPFEFVTIIIPFRNEQDNILKNLKSIEDQLYPADKFEVIYVDDFSDDRSREILLKNIRKNNIKVISLPEDYSINAHKKRAIRFGIENAKGEIIVTTDADCVYDEDWLQTLMHSYDSLTGFVSGPVEFISEKGLFAQFQKLEFAGLVLTGAGLIGSGHPTICNAANISYRKKVFNEVSGFKDNMNLSSGDDELLMQKISRDTDFKVKFSIDQKAIVKTSVNKTVHDFFQQRKRWASKGLFYGDKSLVIKLILIYIFYVGLTLQIVLGIVESNIYFITALISLSLKFIFEFRVLSLGKTKIFKNLRLKYFFLAEIIQIPYIIYSGLVGAVGNYSWKSRKLKR